MVVAKETKNHGLVQPKKLTVSMVLDDIDKHPFDTSSERAERLGVDSDNLRAFIRRHNITIPVRIGSPLRGKANFADNEVLVGVESACCFADYLHIELVRLKMRHAHLSKIAGVSEATIQNWKIGASHPNYRALQNLATAGFDVGYLVSGVR
ncbi:hypothetical protein B0181_11410 [Moraxella caviae]|uniref:Uncharacterized protein n=1 Tax=Moraxella caviae TaxID=34060 RepID=A0A1S9ZTI3_9GAMM|nr:hypothetical protein [Moraxella caviae]OOR86815.1 hypothetical protein B0181_11410 [Moraxella caviae]STZ13601.1 Uncharacterised protein [Moraxella caviae]VEW13309.1 Uncharacterised protein [Moraxella caviae]